MMQKNQANKKPLQLEFHSISNPCTQQQEERTALVEREKEFSQDLFVGTACCYTLNTLAAAQTNETKSYYHIVHNTAPPYATPA
jgi:hypothetical protein